MKKIIYLFICFALYINLLSKNDQILDSNITSGWTKVNNYWEQQYKVEPITYIKLNSANNLFYTNSNNGTIRKWNLEDGTLIKKFSNSLVNVEINTDNENIIKIRSASNLNNFLESYNILNDSILFSTKLILPYIDPSYLLDRNTINTKFLSNKNKYICVIQNAIGNYKYGTGGSLGGRIDLFNALDGSFFKNIGTMASNGFAASSNEKEFVLTSHSSYDVHKNGHDYSGESYFNNYVDSNFVSYHLLDKNGNLIPKQIFNFQFSPNGKMIYGTFGDSSLIWNTFDKKPILVLPYTYNNFAFINDSKRFLVFNKNVLQIRNLQNDLVKDSVFAKDGYVNNVICKIDSSNKFLIGGNDG
ncbi:MAG: hypothetical protein NTW25_03890, partial [Candidatus Kapabacteria bacterium]|nr:hypothetical protein [Candidatus Kapabacteria bacterium]